VTKARVAAAALGCVLGVLATGGLVGAQGGGAEQIHACAGDRGVTRIVATNEACLSGETRVVWNAQGPQGGPGEIGPQGPVGAQGPPGPQGQRGKPGTQRAKPVTPSQTLVLLSKINAKLDALAEKTATKKKVAELNAKLVALRGYVQSDQFGLPLLPKIHYNARNGCLNASSADYAIHYHEYGNGGALGQVDCGGP
jgi:hypothetical protein